MSKVQLYGWLVLLTGSLVGGCVLPGRAQANIPVGEQATDSLNQETSSDSLGNSSPSAPIRQLRDRDRPATTVKEWVAQIEASTSQVTEVTLNRTSTGLEIVLGTADARPLLIDATQFRAEGISLIADIPNTVLALADAQAFLAENPTDDIATVQVIQQDADTIQVRVTGNAALPTSEVTLKAGEFAYSLNPDVEAPEEEVVVTGTTDDGYNPSDSSTATGTDTPLRDIPLSIQVVPQQVLQDRNVTELGNALETVGGVVPSGGRGTSVFGPNFLIRGFDVSDSIFRDGISYFSLAPLSTNDIERVEVLKGPASVLFGQGEPGGIINLVSKKPLSEPYYAVSFSAGNFNTYRGDFDFSGPLNESKTVKYRLNLSYENYGSFRDFVDGERLIISPSLTWDIGPNTSINFFGQYTRNRETLDEGIVALGDGVADLPRDRFLGEDFGKFEQDQFNLGYRFNHRFNESWAIRHALQYTQYEPERYAPLFDSLDESTGELNRIEYFAGGTYKRFFTNAEVVGKFNTGSVQHQLLLGVEYRRDIENPSFQFSNSYPSINIFNPVYTRIPYNIEPEFFRDDNVDTIGVYIQDQVDLLPNLKLLAGVRFDYVDQFRTTQNLGEDREEFELNDSKFTPRVGIVYQPIEPISLYASYTTSFNPSFGASRNSDGSTFEPETGRQFEVGVKADLSDRVSFTLAAFDIRKQNVETPDPGNPIFSLQTGEVTSRGFEFNLAGEIMPGWNIIAAYTYLDAFVSSNLAAFSISRL
ncbi:MAG TPA: TonB-dependent siderophore receptor [Leptolyngbyaceae cyanobacterium M33_DOE_097]|uniref:TonB-dependent siderophore receptor n=1 Tax=Oscillatoriales cyanobacterium SpSt-418 TaxID=2282169 RepID=A0A7C3PFK3_9CYAN|nr:TonB-dependent siderophore receptor [Leptolyngbyaceae cyanobacterium M33_DOE_097]